jgi:hypothetical protein
MREAEAIIQTRLEGMMSGLAFRPPKNRLRATKKVKRLCPDANGATIAMSPNLRRRAQVLVRAPTASTTPTSA